MEEFNFIANVSDGNDSDGNKRVNNKSTEVAQDKKNPTTNNNNNNNNNISTYISSTHSKENSPSINLLDYLISLGITHIISFTNLHKKKLK